MQIVPGARLELGRHIAGFYCVSTLARPVFCRHVHSPPRERTPVAHFVAEQPIGRRSQLLANGIKECHLHAGAQRVVPEQIRGRLADDAVFYIGWNFGPGVVGNGFSPTDCAVVHGDLAQLDNAPVRQPKPHVGVGMVGEGDVDMSQLDRFDPHDNLSLGECSFRRTR